MYKLNKACAIKPVQVVFTLKVSCTKYTKLLNVNWYAIPATLLLLLVHVQWILCVYIDTYSVVSILLALDNRYVCFDCLSLLWLLMC